MSNSESLRGAIAATITTFCAENGFGIPTGFVYCVSRIDEDGDPVLTLGSQENQGTALSLGLTNYLLKNFEQDVMHELDSAYAYFEDEDD